MKFTWFHLMPYRYLPEDFTTRYRSVWVDIPRDLYDPKVGHRLYNDYLDQLEFADQMGFDGLGVNEHHQNAYGLMPSPNIMGAALARRTRKANLVILGNSIALYNPPVRVAEEFAMLDVLSGGRLVAGFPVGTSMDTNFCYGEVPATLREKYREAHDLILKAWSEKEMFAWNGKFTKLRYVNLWPKPLQQPRPPIWIPGGGSIETWDFCAEFGHQYSFLSYFGYIAAKKVADGYWNVMAKKNKPLNPYAMGFAQAVMVAETDEQAERDYAEHMDYFYNRCLHVYQGFADAPGYRTESTIRAGFLAQVGRAAALRREGLKWKDFIREGYIIAGSPKTVRERLREAMKSLNCGHLMILQQLGSMPPELVRKNTEIFATECMPYLRDLWSDWEDHWSPRPLPEAERAMPAQLNLNFPRATNGNAVHAGNGEARAAAK
ncbi:MAG TPA: LLM class flavin-dependent oxidoreductase [Candidatus Binataceae bacterium]|jgi:alkanesulfonate monooxygenase SsuD/methylene tetrahydromethanopterin reductase-like flavin-dependent oxidoreductase (luciferase family)|nr:LLM class flavin-dependent oxidoreductase [Candidatus Binataceae bacterium]